LPAQSRKLPIAHSLSAISYQLSAISYQLSAISYQLSAISYQLSAIEVYVAPFLEKTFKYISKIKFSTAKGFRKFIEVAPDSFHYDVIPANTHRA